MNLSVLIPTLNIDKYLVECLQSLEDLHKNNAEIIIIFDNGFIDPIAASSITDLGFKWITSTGKGVSQALNQALTLSTRDYIARIDSDDLWMEGRYENQLSDLMKYGADCIISNVDLISSTGFPLLSPRAKLPEGEFWFPILLLGNLIYHPTLFCRRDWLMHVGGYSDVRIEDFDLWLRTSNSKIYVTQYSTIKYRIHSSQVSNQLRNEVAAIELISSFNCFVSNMKLHKSLLNGDHLKYVEQITGQSKRTSIETFENVFGFLQSAANRMQGLRGEGYRRIILNRYVSHLVMTKQFQTLAITLFQRKAIFELFRLVCAHIQRGFLNAGFSSKLLPKNKWPSFIRKSNSEDGNRLSEEK
jgi:glycosyltransferase involved in cell wall biosynthesis